jgi:hypothetical protein
MAARWKKIQGDVTESAELSTRRLSYKEGVCGGNEHGD